MVMTNEVFSSNYLKAGELQGREATVTIESVKVVTLNDKRKLVLKFFGKNKSFVVNKTNSRAIERAYGPNTDDWINNQIVLYPAVVEFQGEQVDAIRVRVPGPARQVSPQTAEVRQKLQDQGFDTKPKPQGYAAPQTQAIPLNKLADRDDSMLDDSNIPF